MATLSCILAWRIPWTEKPNRLQSMGFKEPNKTERLNTHTHTHTHTCACSVMSNSLRPVDYSPPGSSVHGILQARIQEWVAMPSSRGSSQPRDQICITCTGCCWVTSVVSDSLRPYRWQPTRMPHPWDSPDKNTGVGCHFLQCMKVKSESEVAQSCLTLSDPMDCSLPGSSTSMGFSRQEYWSGVPLPSPPALAGRFFITSHLGSPYCASSQWQEDCHHIPRFRDYSTDSWGPFLEIQSLIYHESRQVPGTQ